MRYGARVYCRCTASGFFGSALRLVSARLRALPMNALPLYSSPLRAARSAPLANPRPIAFARVHLAVPALPRFAAKLPCGERRARPGHVRCGHGTRRFSLQLAHLVRARCARRTGRYARRSGRYARRSGRYARRTGRSKARCARRRARVNAAGAPAVHAALVYMRSSLPLFARPGPSWAGNG